MGLFTTLGNIFSGQTFSKIDATQEQALVDLLCYAIAIDQDVAAAEEKELTKAVRLLKWHGNSTVDAYVHESLERAKEMANDPARTGPFCADVSERLGEDWLREEAYYMAARVTISDANIVPEEHTLLSAIVEAFAIDEKVQGRITDQLMREAKF